MTLEKAVEQLRKSFAKTRLDVENYVKLLHVIKEVHAQHADDLCWMDIDKIFQAAGLPVPDRRVGNKVAMLKNCDRFVNTMCSGGDWPSYAQLEARIKELEARIAEILCVPQT